MKVVATITAKQLAGNIGFHGETHNDDMSIERIKELSKLLEKVFFEITNTELQVDGRGEGSAREIYSEIKELKKVVASTMISSDDYGIVRELVDFGQSEYAEEYPEWDSWFKEENAE